MRKTTNAYNEGYIEGYVKGRQEVAKEIIEVIEAEIEEFYPTSWHKGYHDAQLDIIALLKKKYLEVQDENS